MAIDKTKILAARKAQLERAEASKKMRQTAPPAKGTYNPLWMDILEIISVVKEQGDTSFNTTEIGIHLRDQGYQVDQGTYETIEACCNACGFRRTARQFPKTYTMPAESPVIGNGQVTRKAIYKAEKITFDDLDSAQVPEAVPTPQAAAKPQPVQEKPIGTADAPAEVNEAELGELLDDFDQYQKSQN